MAFFLTELIRKSRLRKYGSRVRTGFVPLKNIRSALVILDGTEPDCIQCRKKMESFLKRNGVAVSFIYIDLRKKSGKSGFCVSGPEVLGRRDINAYGIPRMKRKGALFTGDADLLINLRDDADFTGDFISKVCKARFKIGTNAYPGNPFDLVITGRQPEVPEGEPVGEPEPKHTSERIDAVCNFLNRIV